MCMYMARIFSIPATKRLETTFAIRRIHAFSLMLKRLLRERFPTRQNLLTINQFSARLFHRRNGEFMERSANSMPTQKPSKKGIEISERLTKHSSRAHDEAMGYAPVRTSGEYPQRLPLRTTTDDNTMPAPSRIPMVIPTCRGMLVMQTLSCI